MVVEQLESLHLIVSWKDMDPRAFAARSFDPLALSSSCWLQTRYTAGGTIWCSLLATYSDSTLQTIELASKTARRPACGFHANHEAPLKLA